MLFWDRLAVTKDDQKLQWRTNKIRVFDVASSSIWNRRTDTTLHWNNNIVKQAILIFRYVSELLWYSCLRLRKIGHDQNYLDYITCFHNDYFTLSMESEHGHHKLLIQSWILFLNSMCNLKIRSCYGPNMFQFYFKNVYMHRPYGIFFSSKVVHSFIFLEKKF